MTDNIQTRVAKILGVKDSHPLLKHIDLSETGLPSQHTHNHWHKKMFGRYTHAIKFAEGKVVLDACCGLGWGAYMLASNAKKVYAIDSTSECINFIKLYWEEPKIVPLCDNVFSLKLEEKVDVVTCMEGIEHFSKEDGIRLIEKLWGHLKDDGILIGSSAFPKDRVYADRLCAKNPHHYHIFTEIEIKRVLSMFFEEVSVEKGRIFTCSKKRSVKLAPKHKEEQISILIANYNNAPYIDNCMNSLFAQTNKNWKAYILDDCSSDSSKKFLDKYKNNQKFYIKFSENNKGYAGTLRDLVEMAETDIVGILDSDDALYPDAVDTILKYYAANPEAGFVYSKYHKYNTDMSKAGHGFSKAIPEGKTNLDLWCVSHFKTFRKCEYYKTEGFDPAIRCAVDKDLALKMEEVTTLHFVDKVLYKWRKTGDSLSTGAGRKKKLKHFLNIIRKNAVDRRK